MSLSSKEIKFSFSYFCFFRILVLNNATVYTVESLETTQINFFLLHKDKIWIFILAGTTASSPS